MELKTQVKALNYTKKLLTGDTDGIVPWANYPQKPVFRKASRQQVPLPTASPEQQGITSQQLEKMVKALAAMPQAKAHCLLVVRGGKLVLQADFHPYTSQIWHVTHSLCKSITGMAIGLLVDKGLLSIQQPLSEIFPEYFNIFTSRRTRCITVEHLLTMSSGINFREIGAVLERDWLRSYFEADVLFEPGTKFDYNSMNTYVLGCIVRRLTQKSLSSFLTEELFDPMGFGPFEWETCPLGNEKAGWGLYLMPQDMAKLGLLLLNKGEWTTSNQGKRRLLSEEWVEQMTQTHQTGPQGNYGMQIWTLESGAFAMNGMYGQYVYCVPQNDVVAVLCSGSENLFAESPVLDMMRENFELPDFGQALPEDKPAYDALQQTLRQLRFDTPVPPAVQPVQLPWYKALLQKWAAVPQPTEPTVWQKMQQMLDGKAFTCEKNKAGLLALMVQCMQSNHTGGLSEVRFSAQGDRLILYWQERNEQFEIPLEGSAPAETILSIGGEQWKVAAIAKATTNEDDVPVLKIQLCFLEHSAVRRIKFFFYPTETVLRMEETPSVGGSLNQMRGTPQADLILDLFKDASYAKYRFDRFSSPELKLIPKE